MKIYIKTEYDNLELLDTIKKMVELHSMLTIGNDKVISIIDGRKKEFLYDNGDD